MTQVWEILRHIFVLALNETYEHGDFIDKSQKFIIILTSTGKVDEELEKNIDFEKDAENEMINIDLEETLPQEFQFRSKIKEMIEASKVNNNQGTE